jgi:hypothetical protein
MNKEQAMNVAIGEACGLTVVSVSQNGVDWMRGKKPFIGSWTTRDEVGCYEYGRLPNYTGSLDAVHEAEKVLTSIQRFDYALHLNDVIGLVDMESPAWIRESAVASLVHATALQRCEALIATLNLQSRVQELMEKEGAQ